MQWRKLTATKVLPCKYHDCASRPSEIVTEYVISQGLKDLDDMTTKYADITPFDSDERIKTVVTITRETEEKAMSNWTDGVGTRNVVTITPTTPGWEDSDLWKERSGVVHLTVYQPKRFMLATNEITQYDTLQEAYVAFEIALNDITIITGTLTARDALLPLATFNKRSEHE